MKIPSINYINKNTFKNLPGSFYGFFIIIIIFFIASPYFLTSTNFVNILKQSSVLVLIAMCSYLAILTHGTDLSIGAIAGLVGVIAANGIVSGMNPYIAVFVGIFFGCLFGFFTGVLIAYSGVPPFIITLGGLGVGEGLALVLAGGSTVRIPSAEFRILGDGLLLSLPVSTYLVVGLYMVMSVLISKRKYGTYLYAVGGNEETAIASGINVKRIKISVYVLNGFFASIAGIVLASRLGSANPSQGIGLEFDGIAAAVLGGTALSGGKGNLWAVFFGAVTMSVLRNGLNIVGLQMAFQTIVIGAVLVLVLSFDTIRERV